jgi:outer membrane protein assembly factor BamE (lipoprotein component of BamABCDE complex)
MQFDKRSAPPCKGAAPLLDAPGPPIILGVLMNRILCMLAAVVFISGCATTGSTSSSGGNSAKARASQLREGMTRGQVESILGAPRKVDHDDGHHHGHGYIPYYGWRRGGYGEEELEWEYDGGVSVTFRRNHKGTWVVKEWDR